MLAEGCNRRSKAERKRFREINRLREGSNGVRVRGEDGGVRTGREKRGEP